MSDFKVRVEIEKEELLVKYLKLTDFLASQSIDNIDPVQVTLLKIQHTAMATYLQCLTERISRL